MQELLVSFLIRMAFLLGEGHKEADYASLHRWGTTFHAPWHLYALKICYV